MLPHHHVIRYDQPWREHVNLLDEELRRILADKRQGVGPRLEREKRRFENLWLSRAQTNEIAEQIWEMRRERMNELMRQVNVLLQLIVEAGREHCPIS